MTDPAEARGVAAIEAAADAHRRAAAVLGPVVARTASQVAAVLAAGGKVLACGNGGSAAECQHFAAELTGRFRRERAAWPAMALTVDTSALTAVGNDYGFDRIFARQVEAFGRPGDVLLAISTSGRSPNVVAAARAGRARGLHVVALTGANPGPLGAEADEVIAVPESDTARVQEVHLTVLHAVCDEVERALAGESGQRLEP
ncbi:phosphoheptose isomerase [Luteitalea sp. TBR-22]|uniref:D-sedoheptulose-7-phosphate isomerase n=1 Tax=Luteitalea sp. TBR-22 TaxID=2802971 RepID=UPI001AFA6FE8|nr:SIS domain-containing protein [Luteitalea sp. TBR-22]BCS34669.1 phosphoheptose isomerase [Luteitalea sp. TBR-22]